MTARTRTGRFLRIEELSPSVQLAGCWKFETDTWHGYRVPCHHLILIESGRASTKTPTSSFEATTGDLICFRHAEFNQYSTHGPTLFYQAHVQFAPPPRHHWTPLLGDCGPLPEKVAMGDAFEAVRHVFETLSAEVTLEGAAHELRLRAAVLELLAIVTEVLSAKPQQIVHLDDWQRLRLRLGSQL